MYFLLPHIADKVICPLINRRQGKIFTEYSGLECLPVLQTKHTWAYPAREFTASVFHWKWRNSVFKWTISLKQRTKGSICQYGIQRFPYLRNRSSLIYFSTLHRSQEQSYEASNWQILETRLSSLLLRNCVE